MKRFLSVCVCMIYFICLFEFGNVNAAGKDSKPCILINGTIVRGDNSTELVIEGTIDINNKVLLSVIVEESIDNGVSWNELEEQAYIDTDYLDEYKPDKVFYSENNGAFKRTIRIERPQETDGIEKKIFKYAVVEIPEADDIISLWDDDFTNEMDYTLKGYTLEETKKGTSAFFNAGGARLRKILSSSETKNEGYKTVYETKFDFMLPQLASDLIYTPSNSSISTSLVDTEINLANSCYAFTLGSSSDGKINLVCANSSVNQGRISKPFMSYTPGEWYSIFVQYNIDTLELKVFYKADSDSEYIQALSEESLFIFAQQNYSTIYDTEYGLNIKLYLDNLSVNKILKPDLVTDGIRAEGKNVCYGVLAEERVIDDFNKADDAETIKNMLTSDDADSIEKCKILDIDVEQMGFNNLPTDEEKLLACEKIKNAKEAEKFKTVTDVKNAIQGGIYLSSLHSDIDNTSKTDLFSKLCKLINIETDNATLSNEAFYKILDASIDKIASIKDFETKSLKIIVCSNLLASTLTNVYNIVDDNVLLLKENGLSHKYEKLSSGDRNIVARAVFEQEDNNFEISDIIYTITTRINNAISNLEKSKETASDNKPSGGGSNKVFGTNDAFVQQTGSKNEEIKDEKETLTVKFNDVPVDYWAFVPINELTREGIINGISANTFLPDEKITREEYIKLIISALKTDIKNENIQNNFKDVATDEWCAPYIAYSVKLGITSGISDNIFGIGLPITRQDAAVMIYRCLDKINPGIKPVKNSVVFSDSANISSYAFSAIQHLSSCEIINGMADGSFQPKNTLTRAEAAKIIYELIRK